MTRGKDPSDPVQVDEYISARIESDGDCWVWTGTRMRNSGYGLVKMHGEHERLAHRFSYAYHRAEIPEGLMLDHLCMNKSCVNPWHLEPVTNAVNLGRWAETNTHCVHGHEYDEANTRYRTNRPGRECRTCDRERARRIRAHRCQESA